MRLSKNPRAVSLRRWRRRNREHTNATQRNYWRARPERKAELQRNFRETKTAENPHYARDRDREFRAANPNYSREWRARKRIRLAWQKWTRTCAASRRALEAM